MQMVPNSLSTNGDKKPAELEAEVSYDTVEVHYMMPNMGSANTNSKQCDVLDKSPSKVRLLLIVGVAITTVPPSLINLTYASTALASITLMFT